MEVCNGSSRPQRVDMCIRGQVFGKTSRAWKDVLACSVHRHEEKRWIEGTSKSVLGPVPMMDVEIEDGYTTQSAFVRCILCSQCGVIQDAVSVRGGAECPQRWASVMSGRTDGAQCILGFASKHGIDGGKHGSRSGYARVPSATIRTCVIIVRPEQHRRFSCEVVTPTAELGAIRTIVSVRKEGRRAPNVLVRNTSLNPQTSWNFDGVHLDHRRRGDCTP
mmetsp:Transcript_13100/g.41502  ORF Transcript_13100/g.41502 Transcript_13100/m.41502 type:complete len:220 (+) Transcript_13100:1065-1724(+)